MELAQLEAFDRVAREGNFTRAAEALNLTQPAVSTRIALLETEVGGLLFDRRGRYLSLTPLGARFLPHVRRALGVLEDGINDLKNYQAGSVGQVKIAAPGPFIMGFMVDVLEHFRNVYPAIDVSIRERNKTTIFDMLDDRTVTLGLVNAPVYEPSYTQLARFRDSIRAVVASGHPLANAQTIAVSDLYHHTIFRVSMFPQMTAFIDTIVEHARIGSGGAVIAVPMVMARRLVSRGQGVTFLPESYVRDGVEEGKLSLLRIEDMPMLYSEPVLITQNNRTLDEVHQAFAEVLKNRLSSLLEVT